LTLNGDPLVGECRWGVRGDRWECKGSSRGLQVGHLNAWARAIGVSAPVAEELTGGQMRGSMQAKYADGEVAWRGVWELRNAELAAPELSDRVRVKSAVVQLQPQRVVVQPIEATAGKLTWRGAYRYDAALARPHRLEVEIEEADVEDLERLLQPALQRPRGFLARTLGIGEDRVPEWLASRRAEAQFRVGTLQAGTAVIESIAGGLRWDADRMTITGLSGMFQRGRVETEGTIRLRGTGPEYDFEGTLENWEWSGGMVNAEWRARTRGLGADWLRNLHVEGKASARGIEWEGGEIELLAGGFRLDFAKAGGELAVEEPLATAGGVKMTGKAQTLRDGGAVVEFTGEGRQPMRMTARARPLQVRPQTGAAKPAVDQGAGKKI
jgi:hypothetical protein